MRRFCAVCRWVAAAALLASMEWGFGDKVAGAVCYVFVMVGASVLLVLPTLMQADEEAANERR